MNRLFVAVKRILTCKPMKSRESFLVSFSIGFGKFLGFKVVTNANSTDVNRRLDMTLFKHFAYTVGSECLDLCHGRGLRQIFSQGLRLDGQGFAGALKLQAQDT